MDKDSNEDYYISFDETNATAEVYNSLGFNGSYSLTEIKTIDI